MAEEVAVLVLNDSDFAQSMTLAFALPAVLSLLDIASNALLILVTIHSDNLCYSCNYVIAYDALMNVGAALGNFVPLWNVVHRQALPLGTCFPVITGPWLCLATTPATIMLVGADRFLNVFFPMQVKKFFRKPWKLALAWILLAHLGTLDIWYLSMLRSSGTERLLLCSYTDFWQNGAEGQAIILGQFIASIIVCLGIYIAIGVRIKTRKMVGLPQEKEDDFTRKIFKSLCAIVLVVMSGWLVPVVFRAILPYFSLTPVQFYVVSLEMIGLCYFFFSSLPPFILFFLSTEYHKAYMAFFRHFKHTILRRHSAVVGPTPGGGGALLHPLAHQQSTSASTSVLALAAHQPPRTPRAMAVINISPQAFRRPPSAAVQQQN